MRKLLIALTLPFALVLAACDTAPTDGTTPAPDAMTPAPMEETVPPLQ